jgi:hypothetical protein
MASNQGSSAPGGYVVAFRAGPNIDAIRALKALLK